MTTSETAKVVQYLGEAIAAEKVFARSLSGHIAMTPSGSYRTILEQQERQADANAERLSKRLQVLGGQRGRLGDGLATGVELVTGFVGQVTAVGKAPLDLLRGGGGEEKMLNNAKDEAAQLQWSIMSFQALAGLAEAVDDEATADLASAIVTEKQSGLDKLTDALDRLVENVVRAEIKGKGSYDISKTKAAQTARRVASKVSNVADDAEDEVKAGARQARKVPGVARAEGTVKGAVADAGDLAISDYDNLTVDEVNDHLRALSQIDLAKVDAYERNHADRSGVTDRISSLQGDEPWPGYDELTVGDITKALRAADDKRVQDVASYERRHKGRQGVLSATERAHS